MIGSLMLDLEGFELTSEETELLAHPMTGGVIFFTRNYSNNQQIAELVKQVRKAASGDILIAVDHEGGRVQRFRSDFTELPAVAGLGSLYEQNAGDALLLARRSGWLMAAEVRAVGIDFSFAPVLDLNFGVSEVIGDRAFHRQPDIVAALASAYMQGMHDAGMSSTGKHFPGHGAVVADSHTDIPVDSRKKEDIWQDDIIPFAQLANKGMDAVMPAHVIYDQLDALPAGFSRFWLETVLRQELQFDGVIFSDDLAMEGASVVGGYTERAEAALEAGCDMILVCNARKGAIEVLDQVTFDPQKHNSQNAARRLQTMVAQPFVNRNALLADPLWEQAVEQVTTMA